MPHSSANASTSRKPLESRAAGPRSGRQSRTATHRPLGSGVAERLIGGDPCITALVTSSPTTSCASSFAVNAASASLATRAADRSGGKSTCTCFEELITGPRHRQRTLAVPIRAISESSTAPCTDVQSSFRRGRWLHRPAFGSTSVRRIMASRRAAEGSSSRRSTSLVWATSTRYFRPTAPCVGGARLLDAHAESVSTQPRRDNEVGASRRGGHYHRRGVRRIAVLIRAGSRRSTGGHH
jgi:hypothetical protein